MTERPPWRRMGASLTKGHCSTPRCNERIVAVVVANRLGIRATVFVCPACDGPGPVVRGALKDGK